MMLPPLFNPSNDLALAADVANYIPPRHVQRMEEDLQSITRFWDSGPWGWSTNARWRYLKMGVSPELLPTDEWLQHHRTLSGRATACAYIQELLQHDWGNHLVGHHMHIIHELQDPTAPFLIYKAPWSSSGKGIMPAGAGGLIPDDLGRVQRTLRMHGECLVDKFYTNKAVDFAMEFFISPQGEAQFLGYSVFHTASRGRYGGQVVAGQEEIIKMTGTDRGLLQTLVDYHLQHLPLLGYTGPLGIDMMRLDDGRIHPVVEINLRRNMGILAITLYERGIVSDQPLTPAAPNGFQMAIKDGLLQILR